MHALFSRIKHPGLRLLAQALAYGAILAAIIYLQMNANFTTPPFVYQSF
jgi:hypothetical protein